MRVPLNPVARIAAAVAALGLAAGPPSVAMPPSPGPGDRAVVGTPLSTPATAVSLSAGDESTETALITASPGGLQIRPGRGDGTFAAPRNVPVPAVSPVAVAPVHAEEVLAAVADGAQASVVLVGPDAHGDVKAQGSIPVGAGPVAMAAVGIDTGDGPGTVIAVAGQASGDVSVITFDLLGSHERRVRLGAAPSSVAASLTFDALAMIVAGTPVGVSVLTDDEHPAVRQSLPVAGGVSAVALVGTDQDVATTLDNDEFPDLVAIRADGALLLSHGVRGNRFSPRMQTLAPPGAVDSRSRLVVGRFGGDRALDFAVVAPDGRVRTFLGGFDGRLHPRAPVASGVAGGAVAAGDVAGDDLDDVIVAGRGSARVVVSGRDVSISADRTAADLTGGFGYLAWWRRDGARYRLSTWFEGRPGDSPVIASRRPARTMIGLDPHGRPAVAYVRCTRVCVPYQLTLPTGVERRVSLGLPPGCRAESVAVWRRDVAYGTVGGQRCPSAARGMWVHRAGARPRRLTRRRGLLGGLDRVRVAWDDYTDGAGEAHVLGPGGPHVVGRFLSPGVEDFINASYRGPFFSGGFAWWTHWFSFTSGDTGVLYRAAPSGAGCRSTVRDLPTHRGELDAAVVAGDVFYADHRGVFRADRPSLEFRRDNHCVES